MRQISWRYFLERIKRSRSLWRWLAIALLSGILVWSLHTGGMLWQGRSRPADTVLVLGGSIQREIHAAEVALTHPHLRFLISQGSQDPCIYVIFERAGAPLAQVWLEKCAKSTFGNFYFSLPILDRWSVRHVRLITSQGHTPRALWLARVMLGSHGIWVTPDLITERGVPGNQESPLKTGLDMLRGTVWAGLSQVIAPRCGDVIALPDVDMEWWRERGFRCERQGRVEG